MNIKRNHNKINNEINNDNNLQNLNESQETLFIKDTDNDKKIALLFGNSKYQFKFSNSEVIMALPLLKLNMKLAINWHIDNTENLEEYLHSIESFVKIPLSDFDKQRLINIYNSI